MKQYRSFFLTTFFCGTACLVPGIALARGGGHSGGSHGGSVHVSGYTRSNGTYVAPHTRAAPGSGSGHSSDSGYNNDSVHVDGYTRKDGTHVDPYTRSEPGSGSGDSNQPVDSQPLSKPSSRYSDELVDSQPVSKPSSVPLNNSDNRSAKSLSQAVNTPARFEFPKPTCGDKPTGNNDTWYPVFIDGGNLDNVSSQFCEDAVNTIREDTKAKTVQVASFNNRDRALNFAQLVGGEVGKPTYFNNVGQTTNTKVATTPTGADTPAPTITPSLAPTSSPSPEAIITTPSSQTMSSSPASKEDSSKGWLTWIIPFLVLSGIVLKRRNVSQTNHLNSYTAVPSVMRYTLETLFFEKQGFSVC
jgi:hypothetical protein